MRRNSEGTRDNRGRRRRINMNQTGEEEKVKREGGKEEGNWSPSPSERFQQPQSLTDYIQLLEINSAGFSTLYILQRETHTEREKDIDDDCQGRSDTETLQRAWRCVLPPPCSSVTGTHGWQGRGLQLLSDRHRKHSQAHNSDSNRTDFEFRIYKELINVWDWAAEDLFYLSSIKLLLLHVMLDRNMLHPCLRCRTQNC